MCKFSSIKTYFLILLRFMSINILNNLIYYNLIGCLKINLIGCLKIKINVFFPIRFIVDNNKDNNHNKNLRNLNMFDYI